MAPFARWRPQAAITRYGVAVLIIAVASALTILTRPALASRVFLLLYPGVAIAAWLGGFGPGIVASLSAVAAADYLMLPPLERLAWRGDDLIRLATFLALAVLVSYLTTAERRARDRADERAQEATRLASQLQDQTTELEQQVEESHQLQAELEEQHTLLQDAREDLLAEARRLRFVGEASRLLTVSLDFRANLRALAQAFVADLADHCVIELLEEGPAGEPARLERVALAHTAPGTAAGAWDLWCHGCAARAEGGCATVLRSGEAEFVPYLTDDALLARASNEQERALLRELRLTAVLTVPMRAGGDALGTITLARAQSGRHFTESDLHLAQEVAGRAAVAIEQARLFEQAECARAEAEEASRAKTEFLAVMSHELRTPLNAIGGYAQLIELGIRGEVSEEQREDLQRIQRSARHLLSLINQILSFTRIDAGEIRLEPGPVAVPDALADMAALVGPQFAAQRITVEQRTPPADVVLWCDVEKLRQILLNLLSNALKFTPAGGTVSIWCEAAPDHADLLVEDTGGGIPPDKLDRVFEPFVQLDRGLTSTHEGAGLGLAISRELARTMGGDLRAEAGRQGARFRLSLPLAGRDRQVHATTTRRRRT